MRLAQMQPKLENVGFFDRKAINPSTCHGEPIVPKAFLITALLLANLLHGSLFPTSAEAGNRWYLRYDTGSGPAAAVFRSKAACEAGIKELKRRDVAIRKINESMGEKEFRRLNHFRSKSTFRNPRCLNRLPIGFLPPSR